MSTRTGGFSATFGGGPRAEDDSAPGAPPSNSGQILEAALRARILLLALLAVALAGLAACHSESEGGSRPDFVCTQMKGVWEVTSEDIGNGHFLTQTWNIAQKGDCSVTITASQPDASTSPFIGSTPATGSAVEGGLRARWDKTVACQIDSELVATVEGSTFTGTLYWSMSGSSTFCSPLLTSLEVTGLRR